MVYEFRHFDAVVLKFSLEYEPLKGTVCQIVWVDDTNQK